MSVITCRSARRMVLLAAVAVPLLSGCTASGQEEMQEWMAQQRARISPKVEPVSEPRPFEPQPYTQADAVDPFSPQKLAQALGRDTGLSAAGSALVAPELQRRKQPLEAYPLDAMVMVGSLVRQGRPVALIKVDNQLYQAGPGQYLGQHYGRILRVTESEVVLREIIRDSGGAWVERIATLQLQERAR